jgi:hypothetical protein
MFFLDGYLTFELEGLADIILALQENQTKV